MKYSPTQSLRKKIGDAWGNLLAARRSPPYESLFYVVETADWSIKQDGEYIVGHLNKTGVLDARTTTTPAFIRNQRIHFGSIYTYHTLRRRRIARLSNSNRIVVTWFHLEPDDSRLDFVHSTARFVDQFHTSSQITKNQLTEAGLPAEKVAVIPLGVDPELFYPAAPNQRDSLRNSLGLPADKTIIGSFQKDGVGWGDGMEPKLVKGPDLLVDTVERIDATHDVFMLLLGPARGYVKEELEARGIPYRHVIADDFADVPQYYRMLDLYLVTSRAEGGPKAVLESMASGVPLVSTRVGMAPDTIESGKNGYLVDVGDVDDLAAKSLDVIEDDDIAEKFARAGRETAERYDWGSIAERYWEELYRVP